MQRDLQHLRQQPQQGRNQDVQPPQLLHGAIPHRVVRPVCHRQQLLKGFSEYETESGVHADDGVLTLNTRYSISLKVHGTDSGVSP